MRKGLQGQTRAQRQGDFEDVWCRTVGSRFVGHRSKEEVVVGLEGGLGMPSNC